MNNDERSVPVACNTQVLATEAWAVHQRTTRQLFGELREASEELPNGYTFRFPAATFPLVVAFVDGERRCCPFFTFRIEVPPVERSITLCITGGPAAKAVVAAALINAPRS